MRVGAKSILAINGVVSAAAVIGCLWHFSADDLTAIMLFYQQSLRQPLFAGLLTVSAFLFSLKTFIIVTMKTNVYDTAEYEKDWRDKLSLNPDIKRYAPLRNFALLLFFAVLVTLTSAVLQFTLGFFDTPPAAIICMATAVWSLLMIFVALFLLQINLRSWFRFLDTKP